MSTPQPWTGPGIILNFVELLKPSTLSQESLEIWLNTEYIPSLISTSAIKSASLYKAANPDYNKQHLIVYKVSDLGAIQAGKLKEVPKGSKKGLFDGVVDDLVEFESRVYSFVQVYETQKHDEEAPPIIMLAMMQPSAQQGGAEDLDAWYREEHNQQMSEQPGWIRTTRFSLLTQTSNIGKETKELSFLAIHEFDEENELGTEVKALEPMTEWTRKVMSEAQGIDAAIYARVRALGQGGER